MLMTTWRNGCGARFAKLSFHFLIPWSWSSNTLATRCEELSHWKRACCCERLRVGGEGGDERIRWVDGIIIETMDMSVSKLGVIVKGREAWCVTVPGVTMSWTQLRDWTTAHVSLVAPMNGRLYGVYRSHFTGKNKNKNRFGVVQRLV